MVALLTPASLVLASAVATAYYATLYPTMSGGDSAELIAAAFEFGIAHPPGYPLFTMLGWVFAHATALGGTVAWRVNLMSSLCDAGASAFLCAAVEEWTGGSWPAGVVAGGLFAFSPSVWTYAVTAEVFSLNNLLLAAFLRCCVRFQHSPAGPTVGTAATAGLLASLMACNQHTAVAYVVPLILWACVQGRKVVFRPANLACIAACLAAGLTPYLQLVAAAREQVAVAETQWGQLGTVEGFLTHVLRQEYVFCRASQSPSLLLSVSACLLPLLFSPFFFVLTLPFSLSSHHQTNTTSAAGTGLSSWRQTPSATWPT
jgi:hypothetical protein